MLNNIPKNYLDTLKKIGIDRKTAFITIKTLQLILSQINQVIEEKKGNKKPEQETLEVVEKTEAELNEEQLIKEILAVKKFIELIIEIQASLENGIYNPKDDNDGQKQMNTQPSNPNLVCHTTTMTITSQK
jgi:hypothetical protein